MEFSFVVKQTTLRGLFRGGVQSIIQSETGVPHLWGIEVSKTQWDSSPLLLRDISSVVSCFGEIQKSTINRHAQNTFYKTKHFRILKLTSSNMLASMIFHSFENHFLKEKKLPLFFHSFLFLSHCCCYARLCHLPILREIEGKCRYVEVTSKHQASELHRFLHSCLEYHSILAILLHGQRKSIQK